MISFPSTHVRLLEVAVRSNQLKNIRGAHRICDTDEGDNSYSHCGGNRYDQSDTAPSPC
jgi:hypothetical protein